MSNETGATPAQIEAAVDRLPGWPTAKHWPKRQREGWRRYHACLFSLAARNLVPPGCRIVDADDLRAVLAYTDALDGRHVIDGAVARLREVLGDE